jgi:hypothetical protein
MDVEQIKGNPLIGSWKLRPRRIGLVGWRWEAEAESLRFLIETFLWNSEKPPRDGFSFCAI